MRAARLRASRSRRSSSTSFSAGLRRGRCAAGGVLEESAQRSASETRKPSWLQLGGDSSSLGIVAPEVVRDDVAVGDVIAERHVDGHGMLGGAAVLLAEHAQLRRGRACRARWCPPRPSRRCRAP